jgi:hypothetical protein
MAYPWVDDLDTSHIILPHYCGGRCEMERRTVCLYSIVQREKRKDPRYIQRIFGYIFGYVSATLCHSPPDACGVIVELS